MEVCQICHDTQHIRIKNAVEHKVIDIKGIRKPSDELEFSVLQCYHHSEQCFMFCNTCDILICLDCICHCHRKHEFIHIKEAYENKKWELLRKQHEMKSGKNNLKTKKDFIQMKPITINIGFTKLKKDICKYQEELKEEIDRHSNKLQDELEQHRYMVKKYMNKDYEKMERFQGSQERMKKKVEKLKRSKNVLSKS